MLQIDQTILQFIQNTFKNSLLDKLMPFITHLGDKGLVWILIIIILLFTSKYRRVGWMAGVAIILGAILGEVILKPIIGRPRPFVDSIDFTLLIKEPTSFSFPSGHTTSSFGAATIIAQNIKSYRVAAYILAAGIAFSRLYLYVHYPSDILAGYILGILNAFVVQYIFNKKVKEL